MSGSGWGGLAAACERAESKMLCWQEEGGSVLLRQPDVGVCCMCVAARTAPSRPSSSNGPPAAELQRGAAGWRCRP